MASFLGNFASSDISPERLGTVKIIVLGNSGVGKTSLAHLISHGQPLKKAQHTVGCDIFVKLVEYPELGPSGAVLRTLDYFVELWDVGAHNRYQQLRSTLYADISGVLLVQDASNPRAGSSLHRWTAELAQSATFTSTSSPEDAASNLGLPVPCLTVANKSDLSRGTVPGGGLLQLAAQLVGSWRAALLGFFKFRRKTSVRKSLLPEFDGAGGGAAPACATRGEVDAAALDAFFRCCIQRRFYGATRGQGGQQSPLKPYQAAAGASKFGGSASGSAFAGRSAGAGSRRLPNGVYKQVAAGSAAGWPPPGGAAHARHGGRIDDDGMS